MLRALQGSRSGRGQLLEQMSCLLLVHHRDLVYGLMNSEVNGQNQTQRCCGLILCELIFWGLSFPPQRAPPDHPTLFPPAPVQPGLWGSGEEEQRGRWVGALVCVPQTGTGGKRLCWGSRLRLQLFLRHWLRALLLKCTQKSADIRWKYVHIIKKNVLKRICSCSFCHRNL